LIFVTEDLINLNPDEMRLLVLFSPPKIRQDNPSQLSGGSVGFLMLNTL
jgi:hypothetical protein